MRVLFATAVFALGLAVAAAQDVPAQPDKKDPAKKELPPPTEPPIADLKPLVPVIEGGYTIGAVERDGQPVPLDGFKDAIVRVVNGRIVATDRDRREFLVATYVLSTDKKPWALNMKYLTWELNAAGRAVEKVVEVKGLAKKDEYVLTLIHALPGGDPPTEFKTKPGQQMFVLRGFVLDPLPPPNKFSNSP